MGETIYNEVVMKTIGIITNKDKDKDFKLTKLLMAIIARNGARANIPLDSAREIGLTGEYSDEQAVLNSSDVIICLGGDGTFLNVARRAYKSCVPMLGINLGSLGFLTEVDTNEIDKAVEDLIAGKYSIEERMMLEASVTRNGQRVWGEAALNDVIISRGALSRILHVKTYINDVFVDTFPGDGLIVASPTGSTAYSLSAGGPIVEPDAKLITVTPICPHILYSRSFITMSDRSVKAIIDENYLHSAMVTIDGQEGYELHGGDIIEVKQGQYTVKMIKINSRNFFNILRSKIYYRGESLKENEI